MTKFLLVTLLGSTVLMSCSGTIPKLGIKSGQLVPCPDSPNCVISHTTDKEHFIQPVNFDGALQDAQQRLLQILKALPYTKIISVQENYIGVEFSSEIFGFIDDAEFYFVSTANNKTIINVRSASRIGHSDLGVNRKRIEQIRNKFKAEG
jgi:uncharacterized protein (DUF1499 family)